MIVEAQAKIHANVRVKDGCWEWTGHVNGSGYPQTSWKCTRFSTHRLSYLAFVGEIPKGMQVDHLCRNRRCVNPSHLEPVTCKENIRRSLPFRYKGTTEKIVIDRQPKKPICINPEHLKLVNSRRKTCKLGHPLSGTNLKIGMKKGKAWLKCRTCENRHQQKYMSRKHGRTMGEPVVKHV
jgi:hypothetical protein